eukprot:13785061-Alexandrium_andersonii.AAC.1
MWPRCSCSTSFYRSSSTSRRCTGRIDRRVAYELTRSTCCSRFLAPLPVRAGPVSYTHLTLPTICSV